ncbi:MAG TPA: VgrG-related protein [Solirubrobacteraceae bacterium]|nr:VgrG-related protein [Solirubrobacteraceae bacterium]
MTTATTQERHVALYAIEVDGETIDERLAKRVREVRILSYLRLPDVCTLAATFPKGRDGLGEPIDEHPFAIGSHLEIKLGAREELSTTTLFKGDVVSLDLDFGPGSIELLVRGLDRSHQLQRSRKVRTFQNQTSSDIAEKILNEAGFDVETDPSGDPHEFIQQDNETDWDFMWRLAERIGFELVVEDGTAHFRRQSIDTDPVELEWPGSLHAFKPRVTAIQQVEEVTLAAQDPKTKEAIEASASSAQPISRIGIDRDTVRRAFDGANLHIATEPVASQSEAQAVVQALLDKLAGAYVAADGVCDGNPKIKAGQTASITGVGQKFSGLYRVAAATHILRGGSTYETRFATEAAHTLLGNVGSSQTTPRFGAQLVVGVVTNNRDPDDMGRVRVHYPALGPDAESAWARILTPSAGNARGLLMLPVVGEEVLIGFEHDDTTRPYVLGSLFGGVDKPGDDLLQNGDGSFALRSDHKVHVASAEDTSIDSGGNFTVSAQGDIAVTAQGDSAIKAQKVSLGGQTEITIEAGTTLTLKAGPSQIQLSSSGVTVSGPMINLG